MAKQVIEALQLQRRATLALLAQLDDPVWSTPCLPPWRIRDVVAHLIAIDTAAVTGRLLPLLRAASNREDVERWNDAMVLNSAEASPGELLGELERVGERVGSLAARLPGPLMRVRLRTVFGRQPLRFLLARRVLDEWVHMVDIARAAQRGAPEPVPAPDVLATAVLDALPVFALPGMTEQTGVVRLVVLTAAEPDGSAPRRTWSVDFARHQYGPRVTRPPDATVRLHAGTLALLAERREPGDEHGSIDIEGDEGLGARMLQGLAGG